MADSFVSASELTTASDNSNVVILNWRNSKLMSVRLHANKGPTLGQVSDDTQTSGAIAITTKPETAKIIDISHSQS
jgi:hypothetical protein